MNNVLHKELTINDRLKEQDKDVVKKDEIFFISKNLAIAAYLDISYQNKYIRNYRNTINDKKFTSFHELFSVMSKFKTLSEASILKYEPSKLNIDLA